MRTISRTLRSMLAAAGLACLLATSSLQAQPFTSGSTGLDGNLTFPTAKAGDVIIFDATKLDTPNLGSHSNIFNLGNITIPAGVTVRLSAQNLGGAPQYWLATGAVDIEGTLDLSGASGYATTDLITNRTPAIPGPGGFYGGVGGSRTGGSPYPPGPGQGPAGGAVRSCGGTDYRGDNGGFTANTFLVPLIGGSGGGGGDYTGAFGDGGGAGGGAILLASSASITINGKIYALGGNTGYASGAGAGGSIRLAAPMIQGNGTISVSGGRSNNCGGIPSTGGLVRTEAFNQNFVGTITGPQTAGTPYATFVPVAGTVPALTVVSVNNVPVSPTPLGNFTTPDVSFSGTGSVPVVVNGVNIPANTVVNVQVYSEGGPDLFGQGVLTGTTAASTVTVPIPFPPGFSRGFISASFTPPAGSTMKPKSH